MCFGRGRDTEREEIGASVEFQRLSIQCFVVIIWVRHGRKG